LTDAEQLTSVRHRLLGIRKAPVGKIDPGLVAAHRHPRVPTVDRRGRATPSPCCSPTTTPGNASPRGPSKHVAQVDRRGQGRVRRPGAPNEDVYHLTLLSYVAGIPKFDLYPFKPSYDVAAQIRHAYGH